MAPWRSISEAFTTPHGEPSLSPADGTGQVAYQLPFSSPSTPVTVDFKLAKGSVYEVVVFQAERYGMGSNYMLTLANFIGGKTQCVPTCGDGVTGLCPIIRDYRDDAIELSHTYRCDYCSATNCGQRPMKDLRL
jgi:hypothetical protein